MSDLPKVIEDGPPIRHVISFFTARPFYVRMRKVEAHSEVETPQTDWILWELKPHRDQPCLLVYDNEDRVSSAQLDYSLEPIMDKTTLGKINGSLPEDKLKQVEKLWLQWPDTSYTYYRSVPRLRSPEVLRDMDWVDFVDNHVVAFLHNDSPEKDPRLALVHKATLLKGLDPYINPNNIQCTNGGSGKSEFYFHAGHNFGKVTTNTFLGFAKSPSEIYPGLIDGKELPVGIDQIESQSAQRIMSFMFNALERGEDNVASGGVVFKVSTKSIFSLLANPTGVGERIEPAKSFRYLLYHLSINAALGRRFGIVIYITDLKKIKHKPSQKELAAWDKSILLFRAVEEYCADKLHAMLESEKIRAWLNSPIHDYEQQVELPANTIEDSNVRSFLNEHGMGAQPRVRGAALYAALVDLLREIALGEATEDMILEHADDVLSEVVNLNISSVQNIASNWTLENADYAKTYFKNLPTYMREILSAIELWHRQYPESGEVGIEQIPYQPADPVYTHLSKCVGKLKKRTPRGKGQVIQEIELHYKFQLQEKPNDGWLVNFLVPTPNATIEPVGKLIGVSPISPISLIHHTTREGGTENGSRLGDSDNLPLSKGGETVKTGKTVKSGPLDSLVQGVQGSQATSSGLGTEENRKEARDFLVGLCKNLPSELNQNDITVLVTELVDRGFTKDPEQAKRFVQELVDAGKLGGPN